MADQDAPPRPLDDANEIIPGLWLGDIDAALSTDFITSHNITRVLSITESTLPVKPAGGKSVLHKQVFLEDHHRTPISQFFDESYEFIESALTSKQQILVHCVAGVSRSATIVLAYLMRKERISLEVALQRVKVCRAINPNGGFLSQLQDFEKKQRLSV